MDLSRESPTLYSYRGDKFMLCYCEFNTVTLYVATCRVPDLYTVRKCASNVFKRLIYISLDRWYTDILTGSPVEVVETPQQLVSTTDIWAPVLPCQSHTCPK